MGRKDPRDKGEKGVRLCKQKHSSPSDTPLLSLHLLAPWGCTIIGGGLEDSAAGAGGREAEERERLRRLEADHMEGTWSPYSAGSGLGLVRSEETAKDIAEEDMVRTCGQARFGLHERHTGAEGAIRGYKSATIEMMT